MRKCTEWEASRLSLNILSSEEDKRNVSIYFIKIVGGPVGQKYLMG